jgi:selenocysteine-specific elongation factor
MHYITLGTAGHIDHGKSALVEALTGINPDRLKEEKERGITIDLGFAFLDLPDGLRVGIVDVPGHERLIKNMLAGAGGIDIVLLVVAADEGIMPQTKEHLAICNLLRIKKGLVAVTKQDLVEEDWLLLIIEDLKNLVRRTFLEGSPIIPVSSKTGYNLDILKDSIRDISHQVAHKSSGGLFRLPVDRVFTMKGFGTVVTGTILSGKVSVEDTVEVLPSGVRSKVRGIQSHNQKVAEAVAGQRTALNLQGVDKADIVRGDVVTQPGFIISSSRIDVKIEMLSEGSCGEEVEPLKNNDRIRFHTGTAEVIGRVIPLEGREIKPGKEGYVRIRLENPLVAMAGDRFIIRRFSPLETLGGGVILDTNPERRKRKLKGQESSFIDELKILEKGFLEEKLSYKILSKGFYGMDTNTIYGWINSDMSEIGDALERLKGKNEIVMIDGRCMHITIFNSIKKDIISYLTEFHRLNPIKRGMPKEDIGSKFEVRNSKLKTRKIIDRVLEELGREGALILEQDRVRLSSFMIEMKDYEKLKESLLNLYRKNGTQPPMREELSGKLQIDEKVIIDLIKLSVERNELVRINDSLYLDSTIFNNILNGLKGFFKEKKEITVAEFRDIFKTSRKYAVPILEYLDGIKFTMRIGDKRILRTPLKES